MIKITQDANTGVKLGNSSDAYLFPNGTIFTGFMKVTEENSAILNSSIEWFINGAIEPTNGLNLPYGIAVQIIDGDEQTPGNRAQYDAALIINTNLVIDEISALFPTLGDKIQVIGI